MTIAACGKDCHECRLYKIDCNGCYHLRKIRLPEFEDAMCPIYKCVMGNNNERTCAMCEKVPCQLILNSTDPELTIAENDVELSNQINRLKIIAEQIRK